MENIYGQKENSNVIKLDYIKNMIYNMYRLKDKHDDYMPEVPYQKAKMLFLK